MKPPTPNGWNRIVTQVIREHPEGISFRELQVTTSTFSDELAAITRALRDAGVIELADGGFRIRPRRRRKPAPGFWARLKNVFNHKGMQ